MTAETDHGTWCRKMFGAMREGGHWGIPRSGMIFTKRGEQLVLTERMPYDEAMPITFAQLQEIQNRELEVVTEEFGKVDIEVIDGTNNEPSSADTPFGLGPVYLDPELEGGDA